MIGKLFGAWLGDKVAGKNEGAKGAILGYGAAALAKRSVPTLAAVASDPSNRYFPQFSGIGTLLD